MRKNKWRLRLCGRTLSIVLLLIFLTSQVSGEPLTEPPPISTDGGTRLYSDLELDALIEDLTEAAHEAIEQAAAEAARAAALAALDREAAALREASLRFAEAQQWRITAETAKKEKVTTAVIAGVISLLAGLGTGLIIGGLN